MERAGDAVTVEVVDGLAEQRFGDVRRLLFEYMATTQSDAGRGPVSSADALHPVLAAELADLRATYAQPGTVFLALVDGVAVGCLGFQLASPDTAEFKRFYVEPAARRLPVARALVSAAERIARDVGLRRVVGDVLPTRTGVIAWYRRLGFVETPSSRKGPMGLVELVRELK